MYFAKTLLKYKIPLYQRFITTTTTTILEITLNFTLNAHDASKDICFVTLMDKESICS
jgi:hypothetical protein